MDLNHLEQSLSGFFSWKLIQPVLIYLVPYLLQPLLQQDLELVSAFHLPPNNIAEILHQEN